MAPERQGIELAAHEWFPNEPKDMTLFSQTMKRLYALAEKFGRSILLTRRNGSFETSNQTSDSKGKSEPLQITAVWLASLLQRIAQEHRFCAINTATIWPCQSVTSTAQEHRFGANEPLQQSGALYNSIINTS